MNIQLPTELHIPSNNIADYTILISGPKKIGKTSFVAQFPDHFILEFEPKNASHLKARYLDIVSWEQVLEILKLLQKNPNYCKTLIFDDIPSAYDLCEKYVCDKLGIEHPSEMGYGKAWKAVKLEFSQTLDKFHNLPFGIIYTTHNKEKDVTTPSGRTFQRMETNLSGLASGVLDALVHLWTVMDYIDEHRIIHIRGSDYLKAGCGFDKHFLTPNGQPLQYISLGNSPEEGYETFNRAFENKIEQLTIEPRNKQSIDKNKFTTKKV